jgi:hypothetical protein
VALAALLVATPAAGAAVQATTVITDADAYVAASSPRTNYGTVGFIRGDGTPRVAYLRFTPPKLRGPVAKATLRVYAKTSSSIGFTARAVANTSWNETTLTYRTRPRVSSRVLARTGAFGRRMWLSLDVTRAVEDGRQLTLALVTRSSTARRRLLAQKGRRARPSAKFEVSSRQGGPARAPRLLIDTTTALGEIAAPAAPTSPQATDGDGEVPLNQVGSAPGPEPVGPPPPPPPPPSPPPDTPPASSGAQRPYDARSPWNTPIGSAALLNPTSASLVRAISDNNLPLTSDPDQYAIPVYRFDDRTVRRTVELGGWFSSYDNGDNSRVGYGFAPTITNVPIPEGVLQSAGSDGQIVFWDPVAGTEYSFWQFSRDAAGNYTAENGNRYHTGAGYLGRFADGLAGRGAGLPYLAGLVRRWEIDQGRIDHALAFAYSAPSGAFVYPASKSDGAGFGGVLGTDLPEGSRLQLDPAKTEADFDGWGLPPAAKTIARALQTYGMYVVDNSGSSKIFMEDRLTAGWDASIDRHLTEKIPWTAFRVLDAPAAP